MERNDAGKTAEIARLVTEQMQDQYRDQAGIVTSGIECTTGLHYEVGLARVKDRIQTASWVEAQRVNMDYHGGASVVDRVDKISF